MTIQIKWKVFKKALLRLHEFIIEGWSPLNYVCAQMSWRLSACGRTTVRHAIHVRVERPGETFESLRVRFCWSLAPDNGPWSSPNTPGFPNYLIAKQNQTYYSTVVSSLTQNPRASDFRRCKFTIWLFVRRTYERDLGTTPNYKRPTSYTIVHRQYRRFAANWACEGKVGPVPVHICELRRIVSTSISGSCDGNLWPKGKRSLEVFPKKKTHNADSKCVGMNS